MPSQTLKRQAVFAGTVASMLSFFTSGRDRPALFLELHPQWLRDLGSSAAEVVRLLEALGYRFRRLDGSPLAARQVARRESVSRVICTAALP